MQILLEKGADVLVRARFGETALHDAVHQCERRGVVRVVRVLVHAGVDVAAVGCRPGHPLQSALSLASSLLAISIAAQRRRKHQGPPPDPRHQVTIEHLEEVIPVLAATEQARRYQANAMAFAMGLQDRLGAASVVRGLDAEVVRLVILADAGACTWFTHREL